MSAAAGLMLLSGAVGAEGTHIRILYAEQQVEKPATLSGLDPVPGDLGLKGAELGISDNVTTDKFTRDDFALVMVIAAPRESLADTLASRSSQDSGFVAVKAPGAELLRIAALPAFRDSIVFNVAAKDQYLREENCRANMLHVIPSRGMLSDAIAQFRLVKKWTNWLLLTGPAADDAAFAAALRQSAVKFGHSIVAEKPWSLEGDMRESAATEIPLITQGSDYDVVSVADESDDFGRLIDYNTDLPRPVAGTHGLVATGWFGAIEPWGDPRQSCGPQSYAAFHPAGRLADVGLEGPGRDVSALEWSVAATDPSGEQGNPGRGCAV